jgi:hypothetical protein
VQRHLVGSAFGANGILVQRYRRIMLDTRQRSRKQTPAAATRTGDFLFHPAGRSLALRKPVS